MDATPLKVFLTFLLEGKTSTPDVFSSCWFIPCTYFESSSVMVKYTSSCIEDQRLSTDVKIVLKYCKISKTVGRVPSINTPPPPLVPWCGYEFACTSRVNHQ